MNDLIERQSVLNACEQSINILEAVDRIMDLPSVEQKPKTEQEDDYFRKIVEVAISQLRADRDRLEDELAKREQEPCDNAVSRQAALDAMYELCNTGETLEENPWRDNPHIDAITDAINNLPSVKTQLTKEEQALLQKWRDNRGISIEDFEDAMNALQEPKTGHWIMTSDYLTTAYGSVNYVKCSCCGEDSLEEGDFCPNCGAKMVEPQ